MELLRWVILSMLLAGCTGTSVGLKFEHHSSAEDYRDPCEENLLGPDFRFPIDFGNCGAHCPELGLYAGKELRTGCFGHDWVGEAHIRMPVWTKK